MFRALVEATCFGAKKIVDRFNDEGIPVKGLIGLGGVAKKSPFIMQMMADTMNMPIRIHKSEQTCALGAAMFAATAAGRISQSRRCHGGNRAGLRCRIFSRTQKMLLSIRSGTINIPTLGNFIEAKIPASNGICMPVQLHF